MAVAAVWDRDIRFLFSGADVWIVLVVVFLSFGRQLLLAALACTIWGGV